MTTKINYCGSKFSGQKPNALEVLFERLEKNTLDPSLEPFCDSPPAMFGDSRKGKRRFFGNFVDFSHTFSIETDDQELIDRFVIAIQKNVATEAYAEAVTLRAKERDARTDRERRVSRR